MDGSVPVVLLDAVTLTSVHAYPNGKKLRLGDVHDTLAPVAHTVPSCVTRTWSAHVDGAAGVVNTNGNGGGGTLGTVAQQFVHEVTGVHDPINSKPIADALGKPATFQVVGLCF